MLVNQRFYARVAPQAGKEDKAFLTEHLARQLAGQVAAATSQTILKVAVEIVRQQDAFFRRGVAYLRPLILRDIAGRSRCTRAPSAA